LLWFAVSFRTFSSLPKDRSLALFPEGPPSPITAYSPRRPSPCIADQTHPPTWPPLRFKRRLLVPQIILKAGTPRTTRRDPVSSQQTSPGQNCPQRSPFSNRRPSLFGAFKARGTFFIPLIDFHRTLFPGEPLLVESKITPKSSKDYSYEFLNAQTLGTSPEGRPPSSIHLSFFAMRSF